MKLLPITAVLAACLIPVFQAGAQTMYRSQPSGTSVTLDGTSTAHDWEMEGTVISGFIEFGAGVKLDKAQAQPVGLQGDKIEAKAHVGIPVITINSKAEHLPGTMDDLMQKAMKATDFPAITYTLSSLTFKGTHDAGKPFNLDAGGDLVIAGKTNKVSFPVTMDPMDGGKLHVTGSVSIKMTDYGVEPPAPNFGLGMMKCGDGVKITFDWMLKERK